METSGAATIPRPDEMFRCATGVVAAADQESGKVSRARRAALGRGWPIGQIRLVWTRRLLRAHRRSVPLQVMQINQTCERLIDG